jgi:hypothetical protein
MTTKGTTETVFDFKEGTSPVDMGGIQGIYDDYIYYRYNQCTGINSNAHKMGLFVIFLQECK